MCLQMTYKMTILCESLIAFAALKLFLPSVCHQMTYKTTILYGSIIAMAALIWFQFSVYHTGEQYV